MRKKKLLSILVVTAMTAGVLVGCGGSQDGDGGSGGSIKKNTEAGTFTMAISYMPDSLQPDTASDDYTSMVRPIYDPLFLDTKDGIEYYLADSLEISEDGLTYKIHLNEDANWSDGEPVTVQDILFSFNYAGRSSGGKSSYNTINGKPVQFNEIDEKTLEITLPEPYASYVTTLSNRVLVMPSHAFDNDPSKVDDSGYFNEIDMATSGAYTVSEINDDSIVYVARDDYYRGDPSVKKIVLRNTGSGSSRQVAFENGEISYMRVTTKEELEKYSDSDEYNTYSITESRLNYLQVNPHGPNKDVLTDEGRKALFLALDGQEIVDAAYGSDELAAPANSLLTPDQVDYNPDCAGYTQDLDKAKELAESSGLSGKSLTYIYNADRANMEAVATVIQQQLAKIGVNLSIEGLDSTSFFQRFFAIMYNSGQENTWDLGTNGWDSERGTSGGQAASYLKNSEAWGFSQTTTDMAIKANATANADESKTLWYELQDQALGEYWEYPLTYTNYVMVSQKNVTGLDASPIVPEFADWLSMKVE